MEIRDQSRDTFDEAIGLSTYYNIKPGVFVLRFHICESRRKQTKLYENIKKSHELIREVHAKTPKEFINKLSTRVKNAYSTHSWFVATSSSEDRKH